MEKISVIVPCFNEEKALPLFCEELINNTKTFPENVTFEIIFIDDGSKDKTIDVIKDLQSKDSNIKYISLQRLY